MAKRITGSTPKLDGYRMPAEFEPQAGVWMLWPERNDNWRDGAKPAQKAFLDVATAILQFEPVTVCVSPAQYQNARERLPRAVRVVEMASNDAWIRDCGPTFLVNGNGGVRAVDWTFNAWGGLVDGLYFPWDLDDQVAQKVCEIERVDSYRTEGFVLEGGSIHVDGEGTVLTTEMCLLSEGRNPDMDRGAIERMLCDYLGCEKVLWLRDGIDPEETNGHIDDVACFIRPGEVACIWTDDPQNPFYQPARDAYDTLSQATDAKGRKLKVHKLCLTQQPCLLQGAATIDAVEGTIPREDGEVAIASYMNFLIVNGGVILPQYGDANDALAVQQVQARFMKLLIEQNEDGDRRRNAAKKKELEAAEKRIAELSAIFKRLYEDSVTGRISDERFTELSADYEAEQKELKERAARLREELSKAQEATANAEKFMNVVRRHTTIEELTPTLLREFVEKIVVHESVALDGKRRGKLRRQEIEIYYSFVGKVELPDT